MATNDHAREMTPDERHEAGLCKEHYSSTSHTPDGPLFSDSLFDFIMDLKENSDTFDPRYFDQNLVSGDPMPAAQARSLVRQYTGEPTDLEVL